MEKRLQLQTMLEELIDSSNVYFQPPSSMEIKYPAIIYSINDRETDFANDNPYIKRTKYLLMVVDKNPDSLLPDKVGSLPMSKFERHYTKDNLNHDVYNLYY